MATRIKEKYLNEAVPALQQKFGYKNPMQIPKLSKIVINMGLGDCKDNPKALEVAVKELAAIAGQQPLVTKARKSIANFKLREGMNVGAKVTLRGSRMEEFMDKLVNIALPRVRDFRGVSDKAFDGRGNYALGIREQLARIATLRASIPALQRGLQLNLAFDQDTASFLRVLHQLLVPALLGGSLVAVEGVHALLKSPYLAVQPGKDLCCLELLLGHSRQSPTHR